MSEMALQLHVIDLLATARVAGVWWHHSPNGEIRDARTGAKLKRMGTSAGFPDLQIFVPGERPAFLELKSEVGKLSDVQKQWRQYLEWLGCKYCVANTPEAALAFLVEVGAVRHSSNLPVKLVSLAR
jgi:hypothetical protein